jgi:hypothetical protein
MEYYASQCTVPCYNLVGIPIRCKTVGETLRYKIIVASGSFILAVVEAFPLQISPDMHVLTMWTLNIDPKLLLLGDS